MESINDIPEILQLTTNYTEALLQEIAKRSNAMMINRMRRQQLIDHLLQREDINDIRRALQVRGEKQRVPIVLIVNCSEGYFLNTLNRFGKDAMLYHAPSMAALPILDEKPDIIWIVDNEFGNTTMLEVTYPGVRINSVRCMADLDKVFKTLIPFVKQTGRLP